MYHKLCTIAITQLVASAITIMMRKCYLYQLDPTFLIMNGIHYKIQLNALKLWCKAYHYPLKLCDLPQKTFDFF